MTNTNVCAFFQVVSFEMSVVPGSHHERVHKPEHFLSSIKFSGVQNRHVKHAKDHNSCSSLVGVVGAGVGAGCSDNDCWKKVLCERNTEFGPQGKNHV